MSLKCVGFIFKILPRNNIQRRGIFIPNHTPEEASQGREGLPLFFSLVVFGFSVC